MADLQKQAKQAAGAQDLWRRLQSLAKANPWLLRLLLEKGSAFFTRIYLYYLRLQRMKPGFIRRVHRTLAAGVAGAALLLALAATPSISTSSAHLVVNDSTGVIADNGLCSLSEAIINANHDDQSGSVDCAAGKGHDTIVLTTDISLNAIHNQTYSASGLPVISSGITIQGQGHSIARTNGSLRFRILAVGSQGNLTLQDTHIRNGRTAVSPEREGASGGGIFVAPEGALSLQSSTLVGNKAYYGGAVAAFASTVTITGSTFEQNWGGNRGGAILASDDSRLTLQDSTLVSNTTLFSGGGIAVEANSTATIQTSTISGNSAGSGGAVASKRSSVEISDSTLTNNDGDWGGGINVRESSLKVTNTRISGNTAASAGGILAIQSPLTLSASTIVDNRAAGREGAISATYSPMSIAHSTISGNTAGQTGGLYASHATLHIANSVISDNYSFGDNGGAYFRTESVEIANSIITGNKAAYNGGGLNIGFDSTAAIVNSILSQNTAGWDGGGIVTSWASLSLLHSTVSDNAAGRDGGGILARATTTIANSTISGNTAGGSGGGILSKYNTITIANSTVSGNTAQAQGGGIASRANSFTLLRSLISGNVASIGNELSGGIATSSYNLLGHNGEYNADAFSTFTPAATDITSTADGSRPAPLDTILQTTLAINDSSLRAGVPPGSPLLTHALLAGSPAVDAAPTSACSDILISYADQRYLPRNVDGDGAPSGLECDIGAIEFQGFNTPEPRSPIAWLPLIDR